MGGPDSLEDYALMAELLETIERHPKNTDARWVLTQMYDTWGWKAEAADLIRQILSLSPGDQQALAMLAVYTQEESKAETSPDALKSNVTSHARSVSPESRGGEHERQTPTTRAKGMFGKVRALYGTRQKPSTTGANESSGSPTSTVKPTLERIKANRANAVDIVFADLETSIGSHRNQETADPDQIREGVRKRVQAIKDGLPDNLGRDAETAFMHVEHEILHKTYQNDDTCTMLGDLISDIPRDHFWVSEDGFAWDMSELANAIKANGGVMRNPLSRQMFTADDVGAIVRHPEGKGLAALQLQQQQLMKGIREDTLQKLSALASVIRLDQEADAGASRIAVDEFLAYSATLPHSEQGALQHLRVSARDSHTGRLYDGSIGENISAAKAGQMCFHKVGDFLEQAVRSLRSEG